MVKAKIMVLGDAAALLSVNLQQPIRGDIVW
jgi:hypothetical protein